MISITLTGNSIEFIPDSENAYVSIDVTLSGNKIEVSFWHRKKY